MGKPFAGELAALADTYAWAAALPTEPLAEWVRSTGGHPLVAVGSGGSLTSAAFAAQLHTVYTGRVGKVVTPFEFVNSPLHLPDAAVLLLTAGGGNPDILACLDTVRQSPPGRLGVLCTRRNSPLADAVSGRPDVALFEHEPPTGKDGFLATNSLLATVTLVARAYAAAWGATPTIPPELAGLLHPERDEAAFRAALAERCRPLWGRETVVVLHGLSTHPAAVDLESKFTEAALGHLQIADYRNFAHGRHHWLARNRSTSAVLALVTPDDRPLADRTLRLLPEEVAVVRIDLEHQAVASAVAAVAVGMHVVGLAGSAAGIDPGRPSVPPFGRKLYHLGGTTLHPAAALPTGDESAAIERKAGLRVASLSARGRLDDWRKALTAYRTALRQTAFGAVAMDYDGTLCGAAERWDGPGAEVAGCLTDLLRAGVLLGVATGRGKSVRKDLRRILPDRELWDRVLVGYHNGGEIAWLADDALPPEDGQLDDALRPVLDAVRADGWLAGRVKVEGKLRQITFELPREADGGEVWPAVERLVRRHAGPGVSLVRSSHSLDALAPGVSKRLLVARVREELAALGRPEGVLCVGDKGRWPGNDFALLEEPHSLSVDEVSPDPGTCWNLAPPGERCVPATLAYLRAFRVGDRRFTVEL